MPLEAKLLDGAESKIKQIPSLKVILRQIQNDESENKDHVRRDFHMSMEASIRLEELKKTYNATQQDMQMAMIGYALRLYQESYNKEYLYLENWRKLINQKGNRLMKLTINRNKCKVDPSLDLENGKYSIERKVYAQIGDLCSGLNIQKSPFMRILLSLAFKELEDTTNDLKEYPKGEFDDTIKTFDEFLRSSSNVMESFVGTIKEDIKGSEKNVEK